VARIVVGRNGRTRLVSFDKTKTLQPAKSPKEPPSVGDWVSLATLNENLLDKEHNLTNHRMAWMMSTQAFLFGAFCLILISQPKDQHTSAMLLNLIPCFGLAIAAAASLGILAAQSVVKVLERERSVYRDVLSKLFSYPAMPDVGCRRVGPLVWTRFGGVWPPRIIALGIGVNWLFVLLGRFGLSLGLHVHDRGY
jgi:hypothetical protein